MSVSMLYTVGTALNRARANGAQVQVLVSGQWLEGKVLDVDGHGVILENHDLEHSVVRIEAVSAVRVHSQAPSASSASAASSASPALAEADCEDLAETA